MKNIIELKVNNWKSVSPAKRKAATLWVIRLFADLIDHNAVSDDFTGEYPGSIADTMM